MAMRRGMVMGTISSNGYMRFGLTGSLRCPSAATLSVRSITKAC
jgi:hypothetical protein